MSLVPRTLSDLVPPVREPATIILRGQHDAAVLNVRFTNNGLYCLSVSQDRTAVLWNPTRGLAIKRYSGPHNREIVDVAITADNGKFVTCGRDKFAFLWDVTTGQVIRRFGPHGGIINSCAYSAFDTLLITGGYDKIARIFDLRAPSHSRPLQELRESTDSLSDVVSLGPGSGGKSWRESCSPSPRIAAASVDGSMRLYDVRKGLLLVHPFDFPLGRCGFSSDERCYVVCSLDSHVHLVETDSGHHLNRFAGHKNCNYSLNAALDPNDRIVAAPSEDGRILLWDICCSRPTETVQVLCPSGVKLHEPIQAESIGDHGAQGEHKPATAVATSSWSGCAFTVRFGPGSSDDSNTPPVLASCHNDKTVKIWRLQQ